MSVRDESGERPRDRRAARPMARPIGGPRRPGNRPTERAAGPRRRGPAPWIAVLRGLAPAAFCVLVIGFAATESIAGGWLRSDQSAAPGAGHVAAGRTPASTHAAGAATPRGKATPPLTAVDPPPVTPRPTARDATGGHVGAVAAAIDPPRCTDGDVPAPHARLTDWATTVVDTAHVLPTNYQPPDLVPVTRAGIAGWGMVRSFVIDDLADLADAARAANNPIAVQSAFRGRARQAQVYAGWVASSGPAMARRFSARPGHSEHELGTALDLRATAGGAPWTGAFGTTAAGRWLAKHAAEYGFVLSYPAGAEKETCYGAEPWHVRYVGRAIAARVAASGLPLRAWLLLHPDVR